MHNLKHHLGSTALSFRDTVQQLECSRIQIKRFAQKHLKRNEVKKGAGQRQIEIKECEKRKGEKKKKDTEVVKENQRRSKESWRILKDDQHKEKSRSNPGMRANRNDNALQKRVKKERDSDGRVSQGMRTRERECPGASSSRLSSTAVMQWARVCVCLCVDIGVTSPAVNLLSGQDPFILQHLAFIQISAPCPCFLHYIFLCCVMIMWMVIKKRSLKFLSYLQLNTCQLSRQPAWPYGC